MWKYSYMPKSDEIFHHGIKGQKWGVHNGPPYPIKRNKKVENKVKSDTIINKAIKNGEIVSKINIDKQSRHVKNTKGYVEGRSYLFGDLSNAQDLIKKYSGKGEAIISDNNKWTRKERVRADSFIGVHIDRHGKETKTKNLIIAYSKTGTHAYPGKENNK